MEERNNSNASSQLSSSGETLIAQSLADSPRTTLASSGVDVDGRTIIDIPSGADISTPMIIGDDVHFIQSDGSVIVVTGGVEGSASIRIDGILVPLSELVQAARAQEAEQQVSTAAPRESDQSGDTLPSSGGEFSPIDDTELIGALSVSELLDPTELGFITGSRDPRVEFLESEDTTPSPPEPPTPPSSTPSVTVDPGEVNEAALDDDGSSPTLDTETDTGAISISLGGDDLAASNGLTIDGVDVTSGGQVSGTYGLLDVIAAGGTYSWSYALSGATQDHPDASSVGTSEGISESFTVVVLDDDGSSASDTLVVEVLDDGPEAADDSATQTVEDEAVTVTVTVNDVTGADLVDLATGVEAVSGTLTGSGSLSYDGSGTFTYTPAAGETGTVSFDYQLTDGDGDPSTATVVIDLLADSTPSVTVDPGEVNEAALDDDGSSPTLDTETDTGAISISLGGDDLAASNGLTIDGVDVTSGGQVSGTYGLLDVIAAGGTYSWSYALSGATQDHPDASSVGTSEGISESFTVVVLDDDGSSASDTLVVEVLDDGPEAADDSATQTVEDEAVTVTVTVNDVTGADLVDLATGVEAVSGTLTGSGSLSYDGSGTFTYTPAAGETGTVSFDYQLTDGDGDPSTATVVIDLLADSTPSVTVDPGEVNEAALDDDGSSPTLDTETDTGAISISLGGDDLAASNGLTIDGVDVTSGGQVSGTYGLLDVIAAGGTYSWSYALSGATQDHPDASSVGTSEGISESFTVVVLDDDGSSASDTLVVEVLDDGPEAADDSATQTVEDEAVTVTVTVNDVTGADLVDLATGVEAVSGTLTGSGSLSYDGSGTFTYTPAAGETGTVSFDYQLTDGDGDPSTATVVIDLLADSTPSVTVDPGEVNEAALDDDGSSPTLDTETDTGAISISLGGDDLAASNGLTIDGVDVTSGGQVSGTYGLLDVIAAGGTYSWSYALSGATQDHPDASSVGTSEGISESFTVVVLDDDGSSASDTLVVEVLDDGPEAADDSATQTVEDEAVTVTVTVNDVTGADLVDLATGVEAVSGTLTGSGSLSYDGSGTFTYTPAAGETGTVSFDYQLTDGDGDPSTATVVIDLLADSTPSVTVDPGEVNEAALDDDGSSPTLDTETDTGAISISLGGDDLAASNGLTIDGVDVTSGGQVSGTYGLLDVIAAGGTYSWSYALSGATQDHPDASSVGTSEGISESFTVVVLDDDGSSASDTLVVEVLDDGPEAADDSATQTVEDEAVTVTVTVNDVTGADLVDLATGVEAVSGTLTGSGSLSYDGSGTFTYTPAAGETGTVSFDYQLTDGDGDPSTATVVIDLLADSTPSVTVDPGEVNEAALDDDGSSPTLDTETDTGAISISLGGDDLAASNGLTIDGVDVTSGGQVSGTYGLLDVIAAGGTYSWSYALSGATQDHPDASSVGTSEGISESFTVVVLDDDGSSASDTLVVEVLDDGPEAADDSATQTVEDEAVTVTVTVNDVTGADLVDLATGVEAVSGTLTGSGSLSYDGSGTFTYTPAAGETGTVSFDYQLTDGDGDPSTATVVIDLLADSTPSVTVDPGEVNEAALDDDGSSPTLDTETDTGAISISLGGDDLAASNGLTIDGVDVTSGGQVSGTYGLLDVIAAGGTYSWSYALSGATQDHPDASSVGTSEGISESFTVVVLDDDGSSASDTLVVEVLDDGPEAADDSATQTVEDEAVTVTVTVNDVTGADLVDLATGVEAVSGTLTGSGSLSYDGSGTFTYTPAAGETGTVSFDYQLTDGDGDPSTATVVIDLLADSTPSVTVDPGEVNEAALDDDGSSPTLDTETDTGAISISLGGDDLAASNGLTIDGVDVTSGGQVSGTYGLLDVIAAGGTYSWSYALSGATQDHPDASSVGTSEGISESFTVVVLDDDGSSASDTLVVEVLDDGPEAADDSATQTVEDEAVTVTVTVNDVTGADLVDLATGVEAVSGTLTGSGSLSYDGSGTFTYTPAAGETGTVSFDYQLTDGDGDPSTATVVIDLLADSTPSVTVDPGEVNEAALDDDGSSPTLDTETDTGAISISLGGDDLAASNGLTIDGVDVTSGGQVSGTYGLLDVIAAGGTYSWSYALSGATQDHPDASSVGTSEGISESFTVVVLDDDGSSASDTLVVEVLDDGPEAADDSATQTVEDEAVTVTVTVNDVTGADLVDLATGVEAVSGTLTGSGSLSYDGSGTFTYTPAAGETGTVSFDYQLTDGDGDPSTATVVIDLLADSTPSVTVDPGEVNEAALDDDGSSPTLDTETDTGAISISLGGDDLAASNGLTIDGVDVTSGGQVSGTYGLLDVIAAGGTYSWSYALSGATQDHPDASSVGTSEGISESFTVVVLDDDGSSASDTLVVEVLDDGPEAADDSESIAAGQFGPATGNVITGTDDGVVTDSNTTDGGADVKGADYASVTSVVFDSGTGTTTISVDADGEIIAGAYGVLTIASDGAYSYTRNVDSPGGVSDVFTYTLTDGDSDTDTADLTIAIENATPTITAEDGAADEAAINDVGTTPSSNGEFSTGTISFASPDGVKTLRIGGETIFDANGGATVSSVATALGVLLVTRIDIAAGMVDYTYVLTDAGDHSGGAGVSDSFAVEITDLDDDIATDTLMIDVSDDAPLPYAPTPTSFSDTGEQIATAPLNSIIGADGLSDTDPIVFTGGTDGDPLIGIVEGTSRTLTSENRDILLEGFGTSELRAYTVSFLGVERTVFTATLDPETDTYEIDWDATIDTRITGAFIEFPAGNNAWLGVNGFPSDEFIDIEDPADDLMNEFTDLLITPIGGGTLNSSNNDIGVGNQQVGAGQGVRIDYVFNLERDDPLDEKDPDGYLFTDHSTAGIVSFTIIELQGNRDAFATVRISAFLDGDGDKILSEDLVPIDADSITIVPSPNPTRNQEPEIVDMGDGTFVITGLIPLDQVFFAGESNFDAIAMENASEVINPETGDEFDGDAFGLGGFGFGGRDAEIRFELETTVTDADGDQATGEIEVFVSPPDRVIVGDLASDVLAATPDPDTFAGTDGVDLVSYADAASTDGATAGLVVDFLNPAANTGAAAGDFYSGIEGVIGSDFNDVLRGDNLDNIFEGLAGSDVISGGLGADTASYDLVGAGVGDTSTQGVDVDLGAGMTTEDGYGATDSLTSIENVIGSAFDDTLAGDDGVNQIIGGAGDDMLSGGLGADILTGGAGSDAFIYDDAALAEAAVDIITDYAFGSDIIDLTGISLTIGAGGDISDYVSLADSGAVQLLVDVDGDGAGAIAVASFASEVVAVMVTYDEVGGGAGQTATITL